MYKYILESVEGINLAAIIALVIFFTVFVLNVAGILFSRKSYVDHMANMPLEDNHPLNSER